MVESSSALTLPLPSYWDYGATRPSPASRKSFSASHGQHEQPARWWGPGGFTLEFYETDFRKDAASRLYLRSPEGNGYWVEGVSLENVEPERVVFTGNLGLESEHIPETAGTVTFRRAERAEG